MKFAMYEKIKEPERLHELVRTFRSECLLCFGKQAMTGLFVEEKDNETTGRCYIYALCKKCFKIPGVAEKVEEKIYEV